MEMALTPAQSILLLPSLNPHTIPISLSWVSSTTYGCGANCTQVCSKGAGMDDVAPECTTPAFDGESGEWIKNWLMSVRGYAQYDGSMAPDRLQKM